MVINYKNEGEKRFYEHLRKYANRAIRKKGNFKRKTTHGKCSMQRPGRIKRGKNQIRRNGNFANTLRVHSNPTRSHAAPTEMIKNGMIIVIVMISRKIN